MKRSFPHYVGVRVDTSGAFGLKRFLKLIDDPAKQCKFSASEVQERIRP